MTIEEIKNAVCLEFGITPSEFDTKSRENRIAIPRHLFLRLISGVYPILTLKQMAVAIYPKKHHSTVVASLRVASDLIYTGRVRHNYYRILKKLGYTDTEAVAEINRPPFKRTDVRLFSSENEGQLTLQSGSRICCL